MEPQANPQTPMQIKTKIYWKKMTLAVATAVILTVLATSSIVNVTQATIQARSGEMFSSGTHTLEVMSGQIALNSKGCYLTGFEVPKGAKDAVLKGNYTMINDNSTSYTVATLTVWNQQQFLNYFSNQNAQASYNKDLMPMTQGSLSISVSEGNYLIMVSGSGVQNEVLETELTLTFTI